MFGGQGLGGFSDFFETLFGGGGPFRTPGVGGRGTQPRPRRGRDNEHTVQVTLGEAFYGTNRSLQYESGRTIEAKIPPGVRTGSRVRLSGQAQPGMAGAQAGDLYLRIEVAPDETFHRDGDDLKVTQPVDLFTFLLGGEVPVSTIDKTVQLTIPKGTVNGKIFRLRGLGMTKLRSPEERGDLYVTIDATMPENLNEAEIKLVEKWKDMRKK